MHCKEKFAFIHDKVVSKNVRRRYPFKVEAINIRIDEENREISRFEICFIYV